MFCLFYDLQGLWIRFHQKKVAAETYYLIFIYLSIFGNFGTFCRQ